MNSHIDKWLRLMALLAAMMMPAVGQAQTDYSGTYYIGTKGYNASTPASNYYLCPSEGWLYYKPTNNWSTDGTTYPNPFLTTFKCRSANYHSGDASDAVWIIEKHPTENYYYIKHNSDGKYLLSNGQITGTSNANRMRVHLEAVAPGDLDDKALFSIAPYSTYLVISPKSSAGWNGAYKWFTVNGGNNDYLYGKGKDGGPAGYKETGGIIGIYSQDDQNAPFYLEDYITRPTIGFNAGNQIEITASQVGATLIYTTDGTTPTAENGTAVNSNTFAFDPADNVSTIKAVAVVGGELSNVTTFTPPVLCGNTHKRLIQSQSNAWNNTDFHFYMVPGDEANNVTKVNTTSLFRPSMEWYFLNAGVEGGVQYYYIVNNANSKYLCVDVSRNVYMDDFGSGGNKFKFSIEQSATAGSYNIRAYGYTSGNRFLNKQSGNASLNPIILHDKTTDVNTCWKFVLPSDLDQDAPFTASEPASHSYNYYKIASVGGSGYYIAHFPENTHATASNTESDYTKWYFEVAQAADASDWLTYYHIRNAVTGEYLYFIQNDNNLGACLETHSTIDPANADRYMFTWAKTADANVNYYIIPKTLKDKSQNQFSALQRNNTTVLQTNLTRGSGNFAWTFATTTYTCATPVIEWSDVENGYVITSTESDAAKYYTADGNTPTTASTPYTAPIQVADMGVASVTLRAIAARKGNGGDASAETSVTVSRVATPGFTLTEAGTVELTCATEGVTYYYEMGDSPSDPTTESTRYTGPIAGAAGKVIKAIAVKGGWINSPVATSETIVFTCATPVIRKTSPTTFTITCSFPTEGVTIRYNMGATPADPTTESGTVYEGAVTFDEAALPITVKAIAYATSYNNSSVATKIITADLQLDDDGYYVIADAEDFNKFIMMVNGENANEKYKIIEDITVPNDADPITIPFTGELKSVAKADGSLPVVSGLTHALFNSVDGGKVNGVILDNVVISSGTNVGAICNVATGASRIYNCGVLATGSTVTTNKDGYTEITACSSTLSGSGCVGGLVGLLDGSSRVINCFSYANITAGAKVGGIVGHNNVATNANSEDAEHYLKTMVMNCMFYGEVSGTSIAPIYNGEIISNVDNYGVSNFNYFRLESAYIQNTDLTKVYNCALGAETRFLQRFEFFRHLLNSNRALAAWWITGNRADTAQVMKWVLEPNQIGSTTPYPILKKWGKYASVVNYAPSDIAYDGTEANRNKGHKLTTMGGSGDKAGTLTVTIRKGSGGAVYEPPIGATITTSTLNLPITDKDTAHFNFNYGKVQLPYYNEVGDHNYRKHSDGTSRVVTGWKIVSITGGTAGTYSTGKDVTYDGSGNLTATPYNFADRTTWAKDLYGEGGSNRVFNQGAYWDVPYGVTAITIEPYWAKCVYLADSNADIVYDQDMTTGYAVPNVGGGKIYTNGNSYPIAGESQKVFTTLGNAIASSNSGLFHGVTGTPSSQTVYDYAVVLVGNYHFYGDLDANASKPYTVTSIDLDGDHEPDYSYILRFDGRHEVHPVRADFINIPGLGMAQKSTGGTGSYNFGIMIPKKWFESTNTSLFRFTQFEYEHKDKAATDALILQGGVMEQWVSSNQKGTSNKIPYIHVGGNVWFKEFHTGCHQDRDIKTFHSPISVTGGDYDEFYLTGLYVSCTTSYEDNAECYINGGRFGTVCGAGMEGIGKADGADNTGNIIWLIQNADIKEFYAGALNAAKPATGNLNTTIIDSHVDIFCGGPKFGDMSSGKTVTTTATGCIFGTFFGAGYGGSSYSREAPYNHNNIVNFPHSTTQAGNHSSWNDWLSKNYKQTYSSTYGGVSTQFNYQFLPMSSNADNVARIFVEYVNFSLATAHTVTSTLTGCTVLNNFYGGGSLGKVDGTVTSILDGCTVYGNVFGAGFSASLPTVEVDSIDGFRVEPYYYSDLGTYRTGVKGSTTTYTWEQTEPAHRIEDAADDAAKTTLAIDQEHHILYTDENLSKSNLGSVNTATLTLKGNTMVGTLLNNGSLKANTGNVYGGGDESAVSGNTNVILQEGATVLGNVFGGGNQGPVGGNSSVTIQDPTE